MHETRVRAASDPIAVGNHGATADVLIEPSDDFYRTHAEECEYLDRSYTANGKAGYVALYQSPKSSRQRETVGNGAVLRGRWIYRGTWLAVEEEDSEELRGWVELSECVPVADYLSFEEVHGGEFVPYDRALDTNFADIENVVLWTYPGSGKIAWAEADAGGSGKTSRPPRHFPNAGKTVRAVCGGS